MITNLLETEALKKYLDDQAEKGWELMHIGKYILTFEKKEKVHVQYAIGIFSCGKGTMESNNKYLQLAQSLDYEFVGDRRGIVVFKSSTDLPFYSDEMVDKEYFEKQMHKNFFHQLGLLLLFLFMNYSILCDLRIDHFFSNAHVLLGICFTICLYEAVVFEYGIGSYIKYYRKGIKKTDYKRLEARSWIVWMSMFVSFVTFVIFVLCDIKYQNSISFSIILICWIALIPLSMILYRYRYRFEKSIEMIFSVIMIFVSSIMITSGMMNQPIKVYRNPNNSEKYTIDTYDIPYSLCHDEACQLIENDIEESIFMKKQRVEEELNGIQYICEYYEIKYDFINEWIMNRIKQHYGLGLYEVEKGEYYYDFSNTDYEMFVQKNNQAFYLFRGNEPIDEEEFLKIREELPWK